MVNAVAYFRTSSASNVGPEKDSLKRQQAAVYAYAASNGLDIISEHYDAAVSGADMIDQRKGFTDMLSSMDDAKIILVETANRFARDLMVQEVGYAMLKKSGIQIIAVDSPSAFLDDTPSAIMIRQIMGVVSQYEKASLVAKLRAARERKGAMGGRAKAPEAASTLAKKLRDDGMSLRAIACRLSDAGFHAPSGAVYDHTSIKCMVA